MGKLQGKQESEEDMEQSQQQQPGWAGELPGNAIPATFGFSIARGGRSGWMLWLASDQSPSYFSSYAEAWAAATEAAVEIGRPYGELPFRPQQPQLAYQPQQSQPQRPLPHTYAMPPAQPSPEPFPNVVERERGGTLADQIAAVKVNGRGAANSIVAACLALVALSQVWPFGA